MSDQLGAEVSNKADELDDDPLAELARIVAGEPEPEIADTASVEELPASDSVDDLNTVPEASVAEGIDDAVEPGPDNAFDNIDNELEHALAQELGLDAATQDEMSVKDESHSDQVAAVEPDLEAAIAEVNSAIENELPAEATNQETNFQDDLISALELEIAEPVSSENVTTSDDQQVSEEVEATEEITMSVEESTAAVLNEALIPDQQEEAALDVSNEAVVPEESIESVEQEVSELEPTDQVEEAAGTQIPVSMNLDEDLGKAFASEFEQMVADNPQPEEDVFAGLEIEEPVVDLDVPELEVQAEGEPPVAGAMSLDELDFGSAFAEELGVEKVTAVEGWSEEDTQSANDAFAEAALPQGGAVDNEQHTELQVDPGHTGQIPVVEELNSQPSGIPVESGGSRKYAMVALAIALLAGSIAAGYGFLGGGSSSDGTGEPKLITASSEPFKVKPEDPGGRVPANQDNASYEGVAGINTDESGQESLISTTEEPADLGNEQLEVVETPETNLAEKSDDRLTASDSSAASETNSTSNVTPRVVQTVTVKPDGTIVTGTQAPKLESPASTAELSASEGLQVANNVVSELANSTQNTAENAVAPAKPVETVTIKKPDSIDGATSSGAIAVPELSPLPKPEPKPEPEPVQVAAVTPEPAPEPAQPAARKSEWVVQVSSQRSPEAAQASFQNLRNRFAALQGRPMSIQRALVNGSTFYRVRVQTESKSDATSLCSSLKSSGGSCFVTR